MIDTVPVPPSARRPHYTNSLRRSRPSAHAALVSVCSVTEALPGASRRVQRGPARVHPPRHFDLGDFFPFHGLLNLPGNCILEGNGTRLRKHTLFFEIDRGDPLKRFPCGSDFGREDLNLGIVRSACVASVQLPFSLPGALVILCELPHPGSIAI
jgi:hypothetical protein